MSKFGIGVGEEFPIDEGKPPHGPTGNGGPPGEGHDGPPPWHRRHGHILHHLLHVVLIVAVICALAAFFHPHPFWHGYYGSPPAPGAHALAPPPYYWAPHFPFGLIAFAVLVSLFVFGRHHHRWHHHHRHHWHGDGPRSHREEA